MKVEKTQLGFTLIELLVVISVIGLLASIIMVTTVDSRKQARNTVRKENLSQLTKALELYYQDNGVYPQTGASATTMIWYSSESGDINVTPRVDDYIPGLSPKYLARLPKDPLPNGDNVCFPIGNPNWKKAYLYISDGKDYKLLSHCSVEGNNVMLKDMFVDVARDAGPNPWAAGSDFGTIESDPNSFHNPTSCDNPPKPPHPASNPDGAYIWAYGVYSSPRSRCW